LPRQDQVYITTNELFRFHNNELNQMICKLDSTGNSHSLEKYQPHFKRWQPGKIGDWKKTGDSVVKPVIWKYCCQFDGVRPE